MPPPRIGLPPAPRHRLWWLKIAVVVGVSLAGLTVRVTARSLLSDDVGGPRDAETSSVFANRCVNMQGSNVETISCTEPHFGRVNAIVELSLPCPATTFDTVVVRSDPTKRLCIGPG